MFNLKNNHKTEVEIKTDKEVAEESTDDTPDDEKKVTKKKK